MSIFKKKYKDKYESGILSGWYEYNYRNIGADFLTEALKQLIIKSDPIFFLSTSANQGKYEKDAFLEMSKSCKKLHFVLSDIKGEHLQKNEKNIEIDENKLEYLKKNLDAKELEYNEEVDIIFDCKGALWYALSKGKKNNLNNIIECLQAYRKYLKNDNSILLVDSCESKPVKSIRNTVRYGLFNGKKLDGILKKFEEESTIQRMERCIKKPSLKLDNYFKKLPPVLIKVETLSMQLSYINRKDLDLFIEFLTFK